MAEQSTEELLTEQKKNCVFCKIVAGEIPSRKVYEDDSFLAFLDINPLVPGHVLLVPKEHIPLLAIMKEEQQHKLYTLLAKLVPAIESAMITQHATVVVQSGYAAGQRPPYHVLLHILPREKNDKAEKFDLPKKEVLQSDTLALAPIFADTTRQVLQHLHRDDLLVKTPTSSSATLITPPSPTTSSVAPAPSSQLNPATNEMEEVVDFASSHEALEHVLASSPELRTFIIERPELVEEYIKQSPKLAKLFENVDLRALAIILHHQQQNDAATNAAATKESEIGADADATIAQASRQERTAATMTQKELFMYIDSNEGLRTWILEHPRELIENIDKNPRLARFFESIDIMELAKKYRAHVIKMSGGGA